jgi:hypothetical protein
MLHATSDSRRGVVQSLIMPMNSSSSMAPLPLLG